MNNEPEVLDDIDLDSDDSKGKTQLADQSRTSVIEDESDDDLGDTELGEHLGQLITEIRRDEENFQKNAAQTTGESDVPDPDPFDPNEFSLEKSFEDSPSQADAAATMEGEEIDEGLEAVAPLPSEGQVAADEDASTAIAQLVSEIESTLQRFTQAERLRANQLIAEKEAEVAEQYRKLKALADKVAKQKEQIQEARRELKAKLELADRLHIEFDGIRQVLNGKLGLLDQLEQESEEAGRP